MRGITSGLQPRRYADGDLVQKALDLGVTPFGMSDEEIMQAIVEKRQTDDISGASADFGEATEGFKRQVKENFFDYTDPLDYATLPLVSLRAAKLAGKAGPAVYNAVRGPASQLGGKISQNIRGLGAYIGVDELARRGIPEIGIPGYENPFGEEAKQARQDAQDEAAEDLKFMTGKLEGEDFVDFELNAEGKKQKGISLIDPDKPMETGTSSKDKADEITSKLSPKDKEEQMMKGIAALFEAYGKSQSGGGTSLPGGPITTRAINTPEITRYQGGGIADMMPQEPMMMAGGGMVPGVNGGMVPGYGLGAYIKKKLTDTVKTIVKKAKSEKKPDTKKQTTTKKKTDTKKETGVTKDAPVKQPSFEYQYGVAPILGGGKKILQKLGGIDGGGMGRGAARLAGYGTVGTMGYNYLTGDPEKPIEYQGSSEDAAKVKLPDSLRDFHLENSMARAQAAGRSEPTFVDYIASFPKSYTDKLGSDPEFAKQMMAGFLAMMKPTEGFVPRNAFVDFGEAALAEGVRQEGEIPEALQTLQALQENPELKAAWDESKRGEITPDKYLQTMAGLMNIAKDVVGSAIGRKIKPKENLVDANGLVVTGAELIKRYQEGDISAVQAYAQTLTPEEG
jgi:hypothetical protein